ncbi:MAG: DUF2254 domain-containing protein [Dongiaceae bacterium]
MLCAVGLALGLIRLDMFLLSIGSDELPWFGAMEADAARRILATTASTMVTIAGLVFSITMVVLQLASSQFGPRLLRTFVGDVGNQAILGTFVSAFLYCLLVLATVRNEPSGFVPLVSTAVGLLFGVAGIGVLVFFIHHIAQSIRVERVVAAVVADLHRAIERSAPSEAADEPVLNATPGPTGPGQRLRAGASGYVRTVDEEALLGIARDCDLLIRLRCRPGDAVVAGDVLGELWPPGAEGKVAASVLGAIGVGSERTPAQDVRYVLRQLAEIAVRALSSGINDPFTAAECIDGITAGLHGAASRGDPPTHWRDGEGRPRLELPPLGLCDLTAAALGPIARAALEDGSITAQLIGAVGRIGEPSGSPVERRRLRDLAQSIAEDCRCRSARDRATLARSYEDCLWRLGGISLRSAEAATIPERPRERSAAATAS